MTSLIVLRQVVIDSYPRVVWTVMKAFKQEIVIHIDTNTDVEDDKDSSGADMLLDAGKERLGKVVALGLIMLEIEVQVPATQENGYSRQDPDFWPSAFTLDHSEAQ